MLFETLVNNNSNNILAHYNKEGLDWFKGQYY